MITPPTDAFYVVRASGEAAQLITAAFSPAVMYDIVNVIMLSKDYDNDIEPINELDGSLDTIRSGLSVTTLENTEFNPLYIPSPISELDEALDVSLKSSSVQFTAMNGNPFAVKSVEIFTEMHEPLISATVSYHAFELPPYEVIVESQTTQLMN